MNQDNFKELIKKFVPTNEIYTISSNDIEEFKVGKNYIYKFKNSLSKDTTRKLNFYRDLNKELNKIELNNASTAFRKNLSYLHFFEPHKENYNFLRLDIRSFFHSIRVKDIRQIFINYISDGHYIDKKETESLLDTFINIVTYEIPNNSGNKKFRNKRVLPMGFLTSPVISNIIFRPLDIQIQKVCSRYEIVYTRYADDMLFSSSKNSNDVHSENFIREIELILFQMKFKLNKKKTLKAKHTLSLNGYTIQYDYVFRDDELSENQNIVKQLLNKNPRKKINELRLSNKKTNIINKLIYMDKKNIQSEVILKKIFQFEIEWEFEPEITEVPEKFYREQLLHKILGYRSYLLSIVQFNKKYHCTQDKAIEKYTEIIKKLEKISDKYQRKINRLSEIIEKKKLLAKIDTIEIECISSLTDWQLDKLRDEGYSTLYDLYEVKENDLIYINGIGKVKAKKIMEIISKELKKY